jgi:hypothetical protein
MSVPNLNEELKESVQILPEEFEPYNISTNDFNLMSRSQVEIVPREQNSFGNQLNAPFTDSLSDTMTFYVSDPRRYLDFDNSYFTADVELVAATSADATVLGAIDVGGIHNLFRDITIKIGGVVPLRIEQYPYVYNIEHLACDSENYTDMVLATSGDSVDEITYYDGGEFTALTGTAIAYDNGAKSLTFTGGQLTSEAKPGQLISITYNVTDGNAATAKTEFHKIASITSDTVLVLETTLSVGANKVDANITKPALLLSGQPATRSRIVSLTAGTKLRLRWKIRSDFFDQVKYFPLPYLTKYAPLQFEFKMNDAIKALSIRATPATNHKIGFKITRPRYVANMVEPSDSVRLVHDELFQGKGIWIPYVNIRHYQNQLVASDSTATFTFQTNISSARAVCSVMVDQARSDGTGVTVQNYNSMSNFLKSSLTDYRFQSGSLRFPDYGPVYCDDLACGEAYAQLMSVFKNKMNNGNLISPNEWFNDTGDKFIMSTVLAKDSSFWTGIPLKSSFLEMTINKSPINLAMNVHSFIYYDSALVISNEGLRVYE